MDDLREEIEVLIEKSKKNSKLSKSDTAVAVSALSALLADDIGNFDYVVNALIELSYAITEVFFANIFPTLDELYKTELINLFLINDKVKKNAANFGINRGLIIINALLDAGDNDKYLHNILKFCAERAYGKGSYQKTGELLLKTCFKKTQDKLLLIDYSEWQENELKTLSTWIEVAVSKTNDDLIFGAYDNFLDKYNLPKNNRHGIKKGQANYGETDKTPPLQKENGKKTAIPSEERIIRLIYDLQFEANNLLRSAKNSENAIKMLTNEKTELENKNSDLFSINNRLKAEIEEHLQEIDDNKKNIGELNVRLKNAFDADKQQQNFELISLKNDLARRLKIDYEDYKILAAKEPDLQYYEALIGIIESIFDTLGKKGIILNKNLEE